MYPLTITMDSQGHLPYLSADLPGIGGRLRMQIEDFQVEEIPAYMPCGEGDHVFAWIEKSKMTTATLVRELSKALEISDRDIGVAGMKDKYAITRQMISLPPPTTPKQVLAIDIEGAKIISAERHGNKLRTGHLQGNSFLLRVRELDCSPDEAKVRAQNIFALLAKTPGAPNWYGSQRFGRGGQNAQVGKALVTQVRTSGKTPRGRQRRLYISAYQSKLFNEYLEARMQDGLFSTVLEGDVLQKRESGGMFIVEDLAEEQKRFEAEELGLTGPMFGHKMKCPAPQSPADMRESHLLAKEEIELSSFAHLRKLANGTRRALSILLQNTEVSTHDDCLDVRFTLPSGCYATAVMREIIKGKDNFPE